jgi:PilZ domain
MSNTVLYEGYAIQSSPRYLAEWEKWQFCIVISFKQHGAMKPREFSSEVFYTTEQEADIQGIAFAQHLIDGKVEGCSVTDMKVEKRLGARRFRVQFPTTLSDRTKHAGSGLMLDISLSGCRLESQWALTPEIIVELRVQVPGLEWPLVIDGARVQWVRGQFVGLAFVRMRKTEQQRLERVIADLRIRGADEAL